jgi:hypothetical protein
MGFIQFSEQTEIISPNSFNQLVFYNGEALCWLEVSTQSKVLRPANSIKISVVLLGSTGSAGLIPKFHVALRASHAALPILISK